MSDQALAIRIHVFLAQSGIASRRAAETLITEGKVTVNGKRATIGQKITPGSDRVMVQNKVISPQTQRTETFLVYKPKGYISTTHDELGRTTVLSLLPSKTGRVFPVGRLDSESEGLMMLTNDGALAYRLTHPKFQVPKSYWVLIDRQPTDKALDHLQRGVKLSEGYTAPAEVEVLSAPPQLPSYATPAHSTGEQVWLEITITEGRNRQVRRMMERVGYEVVRLIRARIGEWHIELLGSQQCIAL